MTGIKHYIIITFGLLCGITAYNDSFANDSWLNEIELKLENKRLARLQFAQQNSTAIAKFTTDGCSGGMSQAWEFMAEAMPGFEKQFNDIPPWQDCCVTHDKVYWQGNVENGFENRLQADNELRSCVIETGRKLTSELIEKYKLNEQTIDAIFNTAANIMFSAVRIGGKPCTLFPWRWGYGWPKCEY